MPHLLKSGSARELTEKQGPEKCRPFVLDVPSQWVPSGQAFLDRLSSRTLLLCGTLTAGLLLSCLFVSFFPPPSLGSFYSCY